MGIKSLSRLNHQTKRSIAAIFVFLGGVSIVAFIYVDRSFEVSPAVNQSVSAESVEEISDAQIETESYAVYSALFNDIQTSDRFRLFPKNTKTYVIGRSTVGCGNESNKVFDDEDFNRSEDLAEGSENYAFKELQLDSEMRDGYRRAARRCRVLSERIDIPTPYVLVDEKEIETLFTDDVFDGWDSFYKKYSDSTGFISLSNVGFAPDLKRAVLYISRECGGKCGTGDFVLLEKDGALWKVHRTVNVWVS